MRFGRNRFDDLVERQLRLVAADQADLLDEIAAAEQAWNDAGREEAEEAYGDFQLAVDALGDHLVDLREAYAVTLDGAAAVDYRAAFNRRAARRFRRYGTIADDLAS
jgi:hypothetical protein